MRPVLLTSLLLVAFLHAAVAQLTIVPFAGVEKSKTILQYNEQSSFSPLCNQFAPQTGIRVDYKFKQQHGPFLGIATSRQVVSFDFSNPENTITQFNAYRSAMQLRFEGGYTFSTQPIYFKKAAAATSKTVSKTATSSTTLKKKKCGGYYSGARVNHHRQPGKVKTVAVNKKDQRLNVRLQPFAGMALLPSPLTDISSQVQGGETVYSYKAGNWSTAFIAGMGFEFAKGKKKLATLNIQYLTGIGNLQQTELTTLAGNKSTLTTFDSRAAAWNMTVGVPISLSKKPVTKTTTKTNEHKKKHHPCSYRYKVLSL